VAPSGAVIAGLFAPGKIGHPSIYRVNHRDEFGKYLRDKRRANESMLRY
jgi:hypothetical protein